MAKRKRLEAWAVTDPQIRSGFVPKALSTREEALRERHGMGKRGDENRYVVRLVECDESETVISKAELRALRAVGRAATHLTEGTTHHPLGPPTVLMKDVEEVCCAVERLKKGAK